MNPFVRHMTHIRNLPRILEQGGLWSDSQASQRKVTQQGIGHRNIKRRRTSKIITVGQGGYLCDYVPFYFCHHSPMLYAIHTGGVEGYNGGQKEVVYLITSVNTVRKAGLPFVFTDGHAAMAISRQYTDPADLTRLDWPVIDANFWKNTEDDGDRERRKQAEFLVHDFLPWPLIRGIAVQTQPMADQVLALLAGQTYIPPVQVKPAWYY